MADCLLLVGEYISPMDPVGKGLTGPKSFNFKLFGIAPTKIKFKLLFQASIG